MGPVPVPMILNAGGMGFVSRVSTLAKGGSWGAPIPKSRPWQRNALDTFPRSFPRGSVGGYHSLENRAQIFPK